MEGRKMAIVPFKLWEDMKRWKEEQIQKPRLPPDPEVSATANLQNDLSSVMSNNEISESEKSQLFGETLHKFKTAHKKALKEPSVSLSQPVLQPKKIDQHIIDSVPSTMKRKAQLLLSMLQENKNIAWDDDGTVKMYGKPIPGSNIIDLVNDVIRHRKGIEPTGWQAFAQGLRELNIPQDVVGNRDRWEWMHEHQLPPPEQSPEDVFVTPPKTKRHKIRTPYTKQRKYDLPSVKKHVRRLARKHIKEEEMEGPFIPKWLTYDEQ